MKRLGWLLILLNLPMLHAQTPVDIRAHIDGLKDGKVYLGGYYGDKTLIQDSAEVLHGSFRFESDSLFPQGMYLLVFPPTMEYVDLFLDEDQQFQLQTDIRDLTDQMEVMGSEVNQIFYEDLRFLQKQQAALSAWQQQLDSVQTEQEALQLQQKSSEAQAAILAHRAEIIEKHPDLLYSTFLRAIRGPQIPDPPQGEDEYWAYYWFRTHYFDEMDLSNPALIRTPVIHSRLTQYLDQYTVQDSDSLIHAVETIISLAGPNEETFQYYLSTLFNKYLDSELLHAEPVMIHLAQRYYLTGQAPWADAEYLEELERYIRPMAGTLVGDKGKNFTIDNLDDQPVTLYDIDADWIVIYFWSYDCGTCKTTTPRLVEMIPSYLEDRVELVSVCTNGDRELWKEKVAEYGLPGIALADPSRTSGFDLAYHVDHTPMVYVLDREFIIRYKQLSIEDLGAVLDFELTRSH